MTVDLYGVRAHARSLAHDSVPDEAAGTNRAMIDTTMNERYARFSKRRAPTGPTRRQECTRIRLILLLFAGRVAVIS